MDNSTTGNKIGLLLLGTSLAVGLILASFIVTNSLENIKLANDTIKVKGFAEEKIVSDIAVWSGSVSTRSKNLKTAYNKLETDFPKVLLYLEKNGIKRDKIDISSVSTRTQYKKTDKGYRTNKIEGYILKKRFEIHSNNVKLISTLSKESTSLIMEDIEFISYAPKYYYSKFNDIKIRLIGKATKNAKARAEQFARSSEIDVGNIKSATQGVFQVTPIHSTRISNYGRYDTTTIEKSVKAVVTIEYSIRNK